MGLSVLAVAVAALASLATGGRPSRLARLHFRHAWLLALALGAELLGADVLATGFDPSPAARAARLAALGVGLAAAGVFLVANRRTPGLSLILVGLLANAAVIAVNGTMPVSLWAAMHAGVVTGTLAGSPYHALANPQTHLRLLADIIPFPLPLVPEVLSAGDVLVAAGAGLLVFCGLRSRPAAN